MEWEESGKQDTGKEEASEAVDPADDSLGQFMQSSLTTGDIFKGSKFFLAREV
jgi:hypothetical protein